MTESHSKMAKVKEDMVNHVVHSKAIFRNEQIDEPDLEISEKKNIASKILEANPGQFLRRFGKFVKKEHFQYFENLETCAGSYELDFYLNEAKKNLSEATELSHKKHVKNRRYAALKKLIHEGSPYFSETEMRRRDPLMYEHLVGRHLSEEERDEVNKLDMSSMTLLGLLLDHMDRDAARALQAQQEEMEDAAREESDGDSEEDEEEEKPELPKQERDLLRREFISHMYRDFLEGKDKDFDYGAVDENTEYDNLEVEQQDAEDKYFDSESPGEVQQVSDEELKQERKSPTGEQKSSHPSDNPNDKPHGTKHFETEKHELGHPSFDSDKIKDKPHGKRHYEFESRRHEIGDSFFDSDRPNAPSPTGKRHYECETEQHKISDPFFDSDRPNAPSPTGKRHYECETERHKINDPFFDSDRPNAPSPTGKRHYECETERHKINDPFFDSDRPNAPSPTGKRHYECETERHKLNDPFFDSDRPNAPSPSGKHQHAFEYEKHESGHPFFDSDKSDEKTHEKKHFESQKNDDASEKPNALSSNSNRQPDLEKSELDSDTAKNKPHGRRHYDSESKKLESEKAYGKPHGKRHYDFESQKHNLEDPFFDADRPTTGSPSGTRHYDFESEKHNLEHPYFDSDKPEKENGANPTTQKSSSSEDELDVYMKTLMSKETKTTGRKQFPGKSTESSFVYSTPMRSDDFCEKQLSSSMEVECSSMSNQSVDDEPCLPNVRRSHPQVTSPKRKESRPVDENDEAYLTNIPRSTSPSRKAAGFSGTRK